MYVLQSFASNHPGIDLAAILTPEALSHLPEMRTACISRTVSVGYWATAIPKDQFRAGADLSAVLKVAQANEPDALRIAGPVLVLQGTADDTVLPGWTDSVVRSLCAAGTALTYSTYPGATHESIVTQAASDVKAWIADRFAGTPALANCQALPSAGRSR